MGKKLGRDGKPLPAAWFRSKKYRETQAAKKARGEGLLLAGEQRVAVSREPLAVASLAASPRPNC